MKNKKKTLTSIFTVIGVILLIVLLLLWLTDATSVGDTDVNAPLTFLQNQLAKLVNIA